MLSSLQALNAAGPAPAARAAAFQPKVKPRARKSAATEENVAATQESQALPSPAAPAPAVAPTPTPQTTARPAPNVSRSRGTQSTLPQATQATQVDTSGPSSSAGPSCSRQQQAAASNTANTSAVISETTGDGAKAKRKRVTASPSPRQRRAEINVDEAIDPATMTMKDIIKLAEAKERKKQKEDAAKKQEQQGSAVQPERRERAREQAVLLAPQVEVVDGKIVINQQSLEVDARALNLDDVGSYRRIDETSSKLNYHSYMKKVPRERWKTEETELFYKSVQQFGTDFAVIERLFPGKTRRQIKAKYKKEEKENPRRMSETAKRPRGGVAHYEELVNKLKAAAAAEKKAADEFDFTWDINTNKGPEEVEANAGEVDAGNDEEETLEQESIVDEEASCVPKHEERQRDVQQQQQQDSKAEYSAPSPPPPALFAYETDLPFDFS